MPLVNDPAFVACEDNRTGIGFTMLNGKEKVVVWIDKAALQALRDKIPSSSDIAVFEKSRNALEAIASTNYDDGIIEPDGSTIIRRDDIRDMG